MISIAMLIPLVAIYVYIQHLQDKITALKTSLCNMTAERDLLIRTADNSSLAEVEGLKAAVAILQTPAKKSRAKKDPV